ncbi:hypothetical protein EJ06DRAFT_559759 [Trichodelitschia bisporula]|uniref:Alpha-ketoglutarate-dependent dioxygenase AlkB-like domain-containing protein n=1 Tax=Trichodelitschia bisporula TaxID=703511 RepID=A0A6G1HKX1_9PEZI|nr:hypothetical protein EJ06DRAFT_559759 [Trichodelitschia bisporula]
MQELVLGGARVVLICGSKRITWQTFALGIGVIHYHLWVVRHGAVDQDRRMEPEEHKTRPWNATPQLDHVYKDLWTLTEAQESQSKAAKLTRLLEIASSCNCFDDRDRVYGMLGIMDSKLASAIQPDYANDAATAFTEAAKAYVSAYNDLELLRDANTWGKAAPGMEQGHHHDTHALPPKHIQNAYAHYNKVKRAALDADPRVLDFNRGLTAEQTAALRPAFTIPADTLRDACIAFREEVGGEVEDGEDGLQGLSDALVYEHREFPGLHIAPSLLSLETQIQFVSQILHTHLANPEHTNSLTADYTIPFPPPMDPSSSSPNASFFTYPPNPTTQQTQSIPQTLTRLPTAAPSLPQSLNPAQFLSRKLRWLTLGTQYHWPTRSYPTTGTAFPPALTHLVQALFPALKPESGVVLLYGAKDWMPVHRDVSEVCVRPLASFSFGCEGIFVIARDEAREGEGEAAAEAEAEGDAADGSESEPWDAHVLTIRVRSGDALFLDGAARWAWHAMPRTLPGTCPAKLADWPVGSERDGKEGRAYERWRGYMGGKRVNVSCRQVW